MHAPTHTLTHSHTHSHTYSLIDAHTHKCTRAHIPSLPPSISLSPRLLLTRPPRLLESELVSPRRTRVTVVSLGAVGCGKSCLIKRYCEGRFSSRYQPTVGVDYGVTTLSRSSGELKVGFFDLSGAPSYAKVRPDFYQGAHGALLSFDLTQRSSFDALGTWLRELEESPGPAAGAKTTGTAATGAIDVTTTASASKAFSPSSRIVYVVGCKADLAVGHRRAVAEGEARLWAESRGLHYHEVSANSALGVSEVFEAFFGALEQLALGAANVAQLRAPVPSYTQADLACVNGVLAARNSYERLRVPLTASREDIVKAYRKMAHLIHPDKCRVPEAEDAFKLLGAARTAALEALE